MSQLLTVSEVASLRGCNHATAWRLLVALERDHGVKLVRQKRTIHVDADELRQGLARVRGTNERRLLLELGSVRRRVSSLEDWKRSAQTEINSMRRTLSERGL
jgi:hypothetical protein